MELVKEVTFWIVAVQVFVAAIGLLGFLIEWALCRWVEMARMVSAVGEAYERQMWERFEGRDK